MSYIDTMKLALERLQARTDTADLDAIAIRQTTKADLGIKEKT
mgnify:CR=1 FL=1